MRDSIACVGFAFSVVMLATAEIAVHYNFRTCARSSGIPAGAWDGLRPLTGPPPWREACDFFKAEPSSSRPPLVTCLRPRGDPESDGVRELGWFRGCEAVSPAWDEPLLVRRPNDIFLDVGAGLGACSLLMASRGVHVVALETRPAELFRLTSGILANVLAANVTVFPSRSADDSAPLGRRVRLMRVAPDTDARLALDGARGLLDTAAVRTVLLEHAGNGSALVPACSALASRRYSLWRAGRQLGGPPDCAGQGSVLAHWVA